jgi:hypothetical protein
MKTISLLLGEYGNVNEATSIPLTTTTTTPPKVPSCPAQWTYFPTTQYCYRVSTFFKDVVFLVHCFQSTIDMFFRHFTTP